MMKKTAEEKGRNEKIRQNMVKTEKNTRKTGEKAQEKKKM